jgi:uncharacterized protein YgiM (DUF1202 family)
MQLARLVSALAVLVTGAAVAAQGDALVVTGSNVNVRAGPTTQAGILARVGADEPAIERRRQGQWVEVELPDQNVLGWIHDSLLATAPARKQQRQAADGAGGEVARVAATDPAVSGVAIGPDDEAFDGSPLGQFRRDVAYFNERAVAAAGVDLFTSVAELGEGGVQVVATEAWATMSQPGQQSYLNALFGRWRAAAGAGQPLRLEIVDPNGALMIEKAEP